MIGRPRCREWTPLATQQLRLRSLIQIVGYNIRPPEWCSSQCSFYVTLHHTTMCAPFYTSERISSPHPKWKEIDSEITQRMSSSNIVIRIWCHILEPCETGDSKRHDLVIQTWGVYFSGLRYIGANLALNFTSECFKSNTLVFQMHGGYFCSYKSLKLDIIPPENEIEHGSLSSDSSGKTNLSKITLELKFIQQNKLKESRSISPSKYSKIEREYSKSHSPIERGFKQNFPTLKTSASLNIRQTQRDTRRRDDSVERKVVDPNYIYEHSPDKLDVITSENCDKMSKNMSQEELNSEIDLSETAENYDLRNESYGCPKYRYMALSFLKSEIRPSYNATKLQKLHLLQYSIKKRQEAVQEIKERIYKKSALAGELSEDDEEVRVKCRSKSQRNLFSPEEVEKTPVELKNGKVREERPTSKGPRLTLKLNDLLSIKAKPSPFQRAEHVRLTKQMEILRFKRIILADERDSKLASIRKLKERHAKMSEENQDVGTELMQAYHTLCKRWEEHRALASLASALRESAARSHRSLQERRATLLQQLRDVFCIQQEAESRAWSICEVPFPAFNEARAVAASEPVAAGYIAQAVTVAAAILHQPLRYKLILLGSACKIVDIAPALPDPNIPLYPRGGDVTLFRYGLFLLNKCLSQLLWSRHLPVVDTNPAHSLHMLLSRSHLPDISRLYGLPTAGLRGSASDGGANKTRSLRSLVHKQDAQFNRFKYSSNGQSPLSAVNFKRHRHSRSVGSYNDDQEISVLDASTTSIMGSEPNIYDTKLSEISTHLPLQKHSSESEISRLSSEQRDEKVIFTLGDGEVVKIESDKLVKISSNNEDECSSCLEQICTEINDFCNVEDSKDGFDITDNMNAIDIAKHMERKSEIEDLNLCESCENNKDDKCDFDMNTIDIAKHMERKSEIEDLNLCESCESNKDGKCDFDMNTIDIAKHMERKSEIEDLNLCESCENKKDGECDLVCANNVNDVVVIPSAEASIDTGQVEVRKDASEKDCIATGEH